MSNINTMHTDELIKLAIDVNAELQSRLRAGMFLLSSVEGKPDADYKMVCSVLLDALRGKPLGGEEKV